jgi:hypothetical protein
VLAAFLAMGTAAPALAQASDGPIQEAYDKALALYAEVELEEALRVTDEAISSEVAADRADDPRLAALLLLRGALIYSLRGDEARDEILESLNKALELNEFAQFPPDLRTQGLEDFLETARKNFGALVAGSDIRALRANAECGEPLVLRVVARLPEGGRVIAYWRREGSVAYQARTLRFFTGAGEVEIPAAEHGDHNVEYYFSVLNSSESEVQTIGTPSSPTRVANPCAPAPVAATDANAGSKPEKKSRLGALHFSFGLGLGTGFGIAKGAADYSYANFRPDDEKFNYTARHASCAAARHVAKGGELPEPSSLWGGNSDEPDPNSPFGRFAGDQIEAWIAAYDPDSCAQHHPVTTGFALAPFHISPRVRIHFSEKLSVGLSARLQVVTASNLYRPIEYSSTTSGNLVAEAPKGERFKPPMPWQLALDVRYLLGRSGSKVRPYVGGFAGFGRSRLRVEMKFAPDVNGNSVADMWEIGCAKNTNVPVFPFQNGCDPDATEFGSDLASRVRRAGSRDAVFDTVTLGPISLGAIAGLAFQISPKLGVFAETQLGAWLGSKSSFLIDLNVGPSLHF